MYVSFPYFRELLQHLLKGQNIRPSNLITLAIVSGFDTTLLVFKHIRTQWADFFLIHLGATTRSSSTRSRMISKLALPDPTIISALKEVTV